MRRWIRRAHVDEVQEPAGEGDEDNPVTGDLAGWLDASSEREMRHPRPPRPGWPRYWAAWVQHQVAISRCALGACGQAHEPWPPVVTPQETVLRRAQRVRQIVGTPEAVAGRFASRWRRGRSRAVAALWPEYAEARQVDWFDASEVLSRLEWERAVPPSAWPAALERWVHRHGLGRRAGRAEAYLQRAVRGWADGDVWNFRGYLEGVVAGGVRHLVATAWGWPGRPPWPEPEDWHAELLGLADRLDALREADRVDPAELDGIFATLRLVWLHLFD